jgi:hypothetical protein
MPTEVVLRHPDLPNQPVLGVVNPDGTVVPNLAESGWVIDLDTDPGDAARERPPVREQAEPPVPHFAAAPEPEAPEPAAPAAPETPADIQPETTEQGDTSLEPQKES